MTIARKKQISLEHTCYYHCASRCVRRAFLCGRDKVTGKDFSHRRRWIEDRLALLASVFAIELLSYAIMHNHYHVVIRVTPEKPSAWSKDEVLERWGKVFSVPEGDLDDATIELWRGRLMSISWYMRCINEPLARLANREDNCSGRFWEGRFGLQALLDGKAWLKCMTYVDLNPIRAGIASLPELADHTAIKARIDGKCAHLVEFSDSPKRFGDPIPMKYKEYLKLLDWTGRCLRSGKRGRIPATCAPILVRMQLSPNQWNREIAHFGKRYYRAVGSVSSLKRYCAHLGQKWLKGASKPPASVTA